ncbi:thrombospondin type-1 domain-containing protein 7B isoform X1 [Tachysurus ichikawai]
MERGGWRGQDGEGRVERTGWREQGGEDRIERTGWKGQGGKDRIERTGWRGQGGEDRIERTGWRGQGVAVEAGLCEETPPTVEVACEVACPGDCVISSWSDWSPCSHSCAKKNTEGKQSRFRTVLALPGKGGKSCPPAPSLEEWRSCNDNLCVVFYWEVSPWGPCVPDPSFFLNRSDVGDDTTSCSAGLQTRKVTCMKINGGAVTAKRVSVGSVCPRSVLLSKQKRRWRRHDKLLSRASDTQSHLHEDQWRSCHCKTVPTSSSYITTGI